MSETILLVDDEKKETEMIGYFLKSRGFNVLTANQGITALTVAQQSRPDLVLLDIRMPGMDGITCLRQLKTHYPDMEIIMATAMGEADTAIECLKAGAFGYLMKPLDLQALQTEVGKALEHQKLLREVNDYHKNLEIRVEERTKEVVGLNQRLKANFLVSIRMLISLIETYDPYTGAHLRRVAQLSAELCRTLKLPAKDHSPIELAALLHDIGTVAIPHNLRNAPFSELTPNEIMVVKQHPVFAQAILENAEELSVPALYVRSHLEHIDGSGFPDGLTEARIPIGSRILGVANAYDEMVNRRRFSHESILGNAEKSAFAIQQIKSLAGKYYDTEVAAALAPSVEGMLLKELKAVRVAVEDLKPGMVLAEDIMTAEGLLLLTRGHSLSATHLQQLLNFNRLKMIGGTVFIQH